MKFKTLSLLITALAGSLPASRAVDLYTEYFASDFDLEGISLMFTPDGSTNFYSADAVAIHALPVDPAGHYALALSDDSSLQWFFANDRIFQFFGQPYIGVNIGSNGYLTFNEHDRTFSTSLSNHFATARISTLFTDLNPAAAGSGYVRAQQLEDRFVVTFDEVYRFGTTNANTFQTELFFDGSIRMSWMDVQTYSAVVGLSPGPIVPMDAYGIPVGYLETDLSSFAIDLDFDDMPDAWEHQYFGSYTNCTASDDFDGDTYNNLAEYICGTHPKDPTSYFSLSGSCGGEGIMQWNALPGRRYKVLKSSDLLFGTYVPVQENILFPCNSYTTDVGSAGSEGFYKVEVELVP